MPIIPEQPGINALAPQQQQPTAPPQGMPPGAGMQQPRDFGLAGAPMPPPEPELPVPIEEDDRDELDVDADDRDVKWLRGLVSPITCRNVAEFLTDDELSKIGNDVKRFFEIDKESRSEWERLMELAMKLAKQVIEVKNTPWPNSSSVKFPLLTVAAIQFAARAYPEIVKGWDLVKTKIVGPDPMRQKFMRGERISKHMSYQLNEEMPEWDEEFDKLLHILPIMGLVLKKTYYDPVLQRNCSDLALIDDVVIHYKAKSIDRVRRITHVLPFYENDIYENVQKKIWLDEEFGLAQNDDYPNDEEAPHLFLEQHCFLDLDGDGYKEPYVVTVHKEHGKVVRIVPRFDEKGIKTKEDEDGEEVVVSIKPIQYFTKFGFIPNPDGSF